ncbi:DivIVA domain-containing protein [Clostridium taeniosporum]|uniref:Cell division protein DivIVA n=1 Tax=Clostridium taeniosporum TaxID=394958 RepID=A0A1D7XKQ6_9CLOT|nr:DivIVA domain-containing protein [Clostridium taeniosporum]AOR23933.1 cell division protein DivIVA [Clostridium taeniosporum]
MKLTPMDITNKEFKKGLRGYSVEEVDEFLDEIVDNYEELYKENSNLKEKLTNMQEKIDHYSQIETTIQNTLVLAQNAAEQAKTTAQKEAELVLKNANETAQKVLDKSHNDVISINDEYEKVKQEFIKFRAKYRNFMNTQLQTFDDLEKDFIKNYNVSEPIEENDVKEKDVDEEVAVDISNEELIDYDKNSLTEDLSAIKSFFAKE